MNIKSLAYIFLASVLMLTGCEYDNYEPPTSMLQGQVVYEGEPIGVRTNAVQLELWQHGYDNFERIPVYVAQDGSFSASLFDGNYQLVLRRGNGPWLANTDSIAVEVSGLTTIDVPVTPYYVFRNTSFNRNGNVITASFNVKKIAGDIPLNRVTLFVGRTQFVDDLRNAKAIHLDNAELEDLSEAKSLSLDLPEDLSGNGYVFARLGLKPEASDVMLYSDVQKIEL